MDGGRSPVHDYVITSGQGRDRVWSWRRLRMVDTAPAVTRLMAEVESMFRSDPEISQVAVLDRMPW